MKSNRFWIVLLCGVALISAVTAVILRQGETKWAYVYLDGELIEKVDLSAVSEPYTMLIESEAGTNIIAVENGRIRVSEADCPDGTCIQQGWISGGAVPIVCLPHKLVIELEATARPDVDAVAG